MIFKKKKVKLLIIDDEKDICVFEKNYFEKRDFRVSVAQTGETALKLAAKQKPDIALIDVHMAKGMNGMEILKKLLEIQPGCRCIMATWDKDRAAEAKKMGAVDYLIKPVQLQDVDNMINKAVKSLEKK